MDLVGRFWHYFGPVGAMSVVLWLGVGAAALWLIVRRRQPLFYLGAAGLVVVVVLLALLMLQWYRPGLPATVTAWAALPLLAAAMLLARRWEAVHWLLAGLAVAGLASARLNSHRFQAVEIDRTEELRRMAEERRRERAEWLERRRMEAGGQLGPEETLEERYDPAGLEEGGAAEYLGPDGTLEGAGAAEPDYAYRRAGPEAPSTGPAPAADAAEAGADAGAPPEGDLADVRAGTAVRTLPEGEYFYANRLDAGNRFFARAALWVAALVVLVDCGRQFNRTFGGPWPWPLAGRLLDGVSPKRHVVHVRSDDGDDLVRKYLVETVRKGETFIYFGPDDPLRDLLLRRVGVGRRGLAWPLPKRVYGPEPPPEGTEFLFEGAWFGRYAFVVRGEGLARAVLGDLLAYLRAKHRSRAAARRTVDLVWRLEADLPADVAEELAWLVREANWRLVVFRPDGPGEALAPLVDEQVVLDGPATRSS